MMNEMLTQLFIQVCIIMKILIINITNNSSHCQHVTMGIEGGVVRLFIDALGHSPSASGHAFINMVQSR